MFFRFEKIKFLYYYYIFNFLIDLVDLKIIKRNSLVLLFIVLNFGVLDGRF